MILNIQNRQCKPLLSPVPFGKKVKIGVILSRKRDKITLFLLFSLPSLQGREGRGGLGLHSICLYPNLEQPQDLRQDLLVAEMGAGDCPGCTGHNAGAAALA